MQRHLALLFVGLVLHCGKPVVRPPAQTLGDADEQTAPSAQPQQPAAASGSQASQPSTPAPQPAPSGPGSFSVTAQPAASLVAGGSADITVSITRTAPFSSAVTITATGLPTGVTMATGTIAAGAPNALVSLSSTADTPAGTATITLQATSGALSSTTRVSLTVSRPAPGEPTITRVTGTRDVRQGYGDVALAVEGANLGAGTLSNWHANPGLANVRVTSVQVIDPSHVVVHVNVAHAAQIGAYDLAYDVGAGASYSGALSISAITVRPGPTMPGDDANIGTTAAPLATVARAMQLAEAGDRVLILAGEVHESPTEPFPIGVKGGVTLSGMYSLFQIDGQDHHLSLSSIVGDGSSAGQTGVQTLGENTVIADLGLSSLGTGVYVAHGNSNIRWLSVFYCDQGIDVRRSGNLTLSDTSVSNSTVFGVRFDGVADGPYNQLKRTSVTLTTHTGMIAMGAAKVSLTNATISNNGTEIATGHDGVLLKDDALLEVISATLNDNATAAIALVDRARLSRQGHMDISMGYWGIYFADDSGTETPSGSATTTIVVPRGAGYGINDARTGAGDAPLLFSGSRFSDAGAASTLETGTWPGPTWSNIADSELPNYWRVENAGHSIQF